MIIVKPQGRLGNMLFQLATGFAHAKRTNTEMVVLSNSQDYLKYENNLFKNIKKVNNINDVKYYKEPNFSYNQIPIWLYKNLIIDGYFQSEKYFGDWLDPFLKLLSFPEDLSNVFNKFNEKKHYCFIHVRRGDYLNLNNYHPTVSLQYIDKAMTEIESKNDNINYIIFSDDLTWCKKHIIGDNITYWEFNNENTNYPNEIYELVAMGCCNSAIIANSSFSWWGAYIGNSKTVIAPKKWFGPDGPQDWQDIYCKDWIVM